LLRWFRFFDLSVDWRGSGLMTIPFSGRKI
jgi:hypothetical protein